jgi:hypothetical protein
MVQVFDDILDTKSQRELHRYFNLPEDRDERPDVVSKSPDPNSDLWPGCHVRHALDRVLDKKYLIEEVLFHQSWTRYSLHADSGLGEIATGKLYKAVLFPLNYTGSAGTTFFKNHWHGPSAKFTKAPYRPWQYDLPNRHGTTTYVPDLRELRQRANDPDSDLLLDFEITKKFLDMLDHLIEMRDVSRAQRADQPVMRHTWISDYSTITNWQDRPFLESDQLGTCQHVPLEDLYGLTLDQYVPWKLGSAIVFDRTQIHCTGNGDLGKLGLTVFTLLA